MRRRLLPLLLLLFPAVACHRDSGGGADSGALGSRAEAGRGPDPIVVRLPRAGGTARAYLFPKLDSVIWSGHTTSVDRVLGFDPDGGQLAIIDAKGDPARVDFHMGDASIALKGELASVTSPSGSDIYGVNSKGMVVRLTRAGDWTFTPPAPARAVFPQTDHSVVVAAQRGAGTILWRMYPPDEQLRDTLKLDIGLKGPHVQAGDRIYFGTDTAVISINTRNLTAAPSIPVPHRVVALAPTPSGDRVYVATAGDSALDVIDRYTDKIAAHVTLPGTASELRMDRLGRYVLARPTRGDSAWVIAVATNHLLGAARTRWTDDLPAAAPDGEIAVSVGPDVLLLDGETLQPLRTIGGGASDYWLFIFWNGFRARAAGVDQPVSFASADSAVDSARAADSVAKAAAESTVAPAQSAPPANVANAAAAPPAQPAPAAARPAEPAATSGAPTSWTVSFAALLTPEKARALADSIHVDGAAARVVPAQRAGTTIYRVVIGPYPSREAADRAGRDSHHAYWVFSGQP